MGDYFNGTAAPNPYPTEPAVSDQTTPADNLNWGDARFNYGPGDADGTPGGAPTGGRQ